MDRKFSILAVLFLVCSGLVACNPASNSPGPCCGMPAPPFIEGTVRDSSTGEPLSGVTVEVGGSGFIVHESSDVSGADGKYRVDNTGDVISAVKRGYGTYRESIAHLDRTTTVTYDISLAPGSATDTTPPASPLTRMIKPDDWHGSDNFISWYPPPGSTDVAGYTIYRGNSALATTFFAGYQDFGLINTQYCYTVAAFDASGNESPPSGEMCATPSAYRNSYTYSVPESVRVTVISSNEVRVDWSSRGAWAHNVYRDGGALVRALAEGENSSLFSSSYYDVFFQDIGLMPGVKYCYSVTSVQSSGETAPCPQICVTTWP